MPVKAPDAEGTDLTGLHAPLHRLTEVQINRSVADLFGNPALPQVSLPPDVAVHGFRNNANTRAATPYLVESLQADLTAVARQAALDGGGWLPCTSDGGADPVGCGTVALEGLMPKAWRRPVSDGERAWLVDAFVQWESSLGFETALELALSAMLQAPEFLYEVEEGDATRAVGDVRPLTDWEVAARLGLLLWDSLPDDTLRARAAAGDLSTESAVREEAARMLADPRADAARLEFFRAWLGRELTTELSPSYAHHAETVLSAEEFDELEDIRAEGSPDALQHYEEEWGFVVTELQTTYEAEFDLFVESVLVDDPTLRALLLSRQGFVSERTARLYGVVATGEPTHVYLPEIEDDDVHPVDLYEVMLPASQRAGLFTRGAFLGGLSHPDQPSPVLRGVFLRERLLCIETGAPPDDVPAVAAVDGGEVVTNRDRYAVHGSDPACTSCHAGIDGAGFVFESYDAVGAWRSVDNGEVVDASGELVGTDVDGVVDGPLTLVDQLAGSRQVHDCAVTQLYRYALHHTETEVDLPALDVLQASFWESGGDLDQLVVELVASDAFRTLRVEGEAAR